LEISEIEIVEIRKKKKRKAKKKKKEKKDVDSGHGCGGSERLNNYVNSVSLVLILHSSLVSF